SLFIENNIVESSDELISDIDEDIIPDVPMVDSFTNDDSNDELDEIDDEEISLELPNENDSVNSESSDAVELDDILTLDDIAEPVEPTALEEVEILEDQEFIDDESSIETSVAEPLGVGDDTDSDETVSEINFDDIGQPAASEEDASELVEEFEEERDDEAEYELEEPVTPAPPIQKSTPVVQQPVTQQRQVFNAEDDEDYDPEIIEIFVEEANELLEDMERALHDWQEDWNNTDCVEELKRCLHTFKGGARLAGLTELGDLSHDFETMLIEMDTDAELDQNFFKQLNNYQDQLHSGVGLVQARLNGEIPADQEPQAVEDIASDYDEVVEETPGQNEIAAEQELYAAKIQLGKVAGLSSEESLLLDIPENDYPTVSQSLYKKGIAQADFIRIAKEERADLRAARQGNEALR
ncbi:MAG: hypothetical protein EOP04_26800, partial [Proteobacteria bacterium]